MKCFVMAIDGVAASGKGTLSKKLAAHYGFDYLDTGVIYRKVAFYALKDAIDINDPASVVACIERYDISAPINEPLHTEQISSTASVIGVHKDVRNALNQAQRDFALGKKGVVLDGRDIGTIIFPNADLKLFITADVEVRAERRFKQLQKEGKQVIFDEVLKNLRERDERDTYRKVAPTVAADDAIVIDTSNLNADAVLELAISLSHKTIMDSLKAA
jgi:cytidylate kinase